MKPINPTYPYRYLPMMALVLILMAHTAQAQNKEVPIIEHAAYEKLISNSTKKVQVVNFWATWCKPCVAEMPHLVELAKKYGDKIDLFLISFDQIKDVPRVQAFIKARGIQSPVYILDEIPNEALINKIDKRWQGGLPLTIFVKKGKNVALTEGAFDSFEQITQKLIPFLR